MIFAYAVVAGVMIAAAVAAISDDDADRLDRSPLPATVCPNCSAYYLGIRCASCGWTEPDDEPDDDATDLEPTMPDLGGSD